MTVARRDWRGAYVHPAAVRVQVHEAFGWKVHQHVMPAGSSLVLTSTVDVDRESAPNLTLYVRGRASIGRAVGSSAQEMYLDRVPGMFSGDRGPHPRGVVTLCAVEETEFWCFNWHANRGALPALTPIRLPQGGDAGLDPGQRVLVCAGFIDGLGPGHSFVAGIRPQEAAAGTYGFAITGGRDEAV